jgi:hypothetical protein
MGESKYNLQVRLPISAVLAHLRIPAGMLAEMGSADVIEVEAEQAGPPMVSFEVEGHTIARGYAHQKHGRLTGFIFWTGCQPSRLPCARWTMKKAPLPDGHSEVEDGTK